MLQIDTHASGAGANEGARQCAQPVIGNGLCRLNRMEHTGAGLAAHNMTQSSRAALEQMVRDVASGDGLLTAAKKAYKHVYQTFEKYERYGATDTEPRGVLIQLIEEYARRRFEVEVDLYWEV